MAYYMAMAPSILPGITDRPLTYRPYPHGPDLRAPVDKSARYRS
jgi:hypothetical protein